MRILDELEHRLVTDWNLLLELDPENTCQCAALSTSGKLTEKALPALIAVARAAETLKKAKMEESGQAIALAALFEALQALSEMGGEE
jgi:hypothetical protein